MAYQTAPKQFTLSDDVGGLADFLGVFGRNLTFSEPLKSERPSLDNHVLSPQNILISEVINRYYAGSIVYLGRSQDSQQQIAIKFPAKIGRAHV